MLLSRLFRHWGARLEPRDGFRQELLDALLKRAESVEPVLGLRQNGHHFWRRVLKAAVPALAAVLVVAVGVWFLLIGDVKEASASFGDVVRNVSRARTVSFDAQYARDGGEVQTVRMIVAYPGRARAELPDGKILVIDLEKGRQLSLRPSKREAILSRTTSDITYLEPLDELRSTIASEGTCVGSGEINGIKADIYEVARTNGYMRVWADVRTHLPVRVEHHSSLPGEGDRHVLLKNFRWGEVVPSEQLSLNPPPEFTLWRPEVEGDLEAVLHLLRVCASGPQRLFPPVLDRQTALERVAALWPKDVDLPASHTDPDPGPRLTRIDGQAKESFRKCLIALAFIKTLEDSDMWWYGGGGKGLDDSRAMICWWKKTDGEGYVAVYGDLSVRLLSEEQLDDVD
jgi:hypothetical protein